MAEFVIKWETSKESGSDDLLTEENLNKVGIAESEIKEINPFFIFPGNVYTEPGVARPEHPCCGSAGVNIVTNDDKHASIQRIFYHDEGHSHGPLKNLAHWNKESRFVNVSGNEERAPSSTDHVIEDTDSITISLVDSLGREKKQTVNKD